MKGKRSLLNVLVIGLLLGVFLPSSPVVGAATITVTTTVDEFDAGDPADRACSLREAIQAAALDAKFGGCAAGSGIDTIELEAGTYQLSLTGIEDLNAAGDLDILSSLTIQGQGSRDTIIDGGGIDRVLDITSTAKVSVVALTIRNGQSLHGDDGMEGLIPGDDGTEGGDGQPGGGIRNFGILLLTKTTVTENRSGNGGDGGDGADGAGDDGGAGGNAGDGGLGGGIYNADGASLVLNGTIVSNNVSGQGGSGGSGGLGGDGGPGEDGYSGGYGGYPGYGGDGGGLYNATGGTIEIHSGTLDSNQTGNGGAGGSGGDGGVGGDGTSGGTGGYGAEGSSGRRGGRGGGLYNAGTATIDGNSRIVDNLTGDGGPGGWGGNGALGGNGGTGSSDTGGDGGDAGYGAQGGYGGSGGGIHNRGGVLEITGCTVLGNQTGDGGTGGVGGNGGDGGAGSGGGYGASGADGGNGGNGGDGGGIYHESAGAVLTLASSTISENIAGNSGLGNSGGQGGNGGAGSGGSGGDGGSGGEAGSGSYGGDGGGIFALAPMTIDRSTISLNVTGTGVGAGTAGAGGSGGNGSTGGGVGGDGGNGDHGGLGGIGGGIYFSSKTMTVTLSTVAENTTGNGVNGSSGANGGAGGGTNDDGNGGRGGAGGDGGYGGGLYLSSSAVIHMSGSTIRDNTTGNGGDAGDGGDGETAGEGSNGGAGGAGGGIYQHFTTTTLTNCTVSGNSMGQGGNGGDSGTGITTPLSDGGDGGDAGLGGGVYISSGTLTLVGCTIADNQANGTGGTAGTGSPAGVDGVDGQGGGIYNSKDALALDVVLSILGDSSAADTGADCYGPLTSSDYNLIENTAGCTIGGTTAHDVTGVDPLLSTLGDHGGPTWTHWLYPRSPALDAGGAMCTLAIDQRGETRPYDGDESGAAQCDIGALEVQGYQRVYLPAVLKSY